MKRVHTRVGMEQMARDQQVQHRVPQELQPLVARHLHRTNGKHSEPESYLNALQRCCLRVQHCVSQNSSRWLHGTCTGKKGKCSNRTPCFVQNITCWVDAAALRQMSQASAYGCTLLLRRQIEVMMVKLARTRTSTAYRRVGPAAVCERLCQERTVDKAIVERVLDRHPARCLRLFGQ